MGLHELILRLLGAVITFSDTNTGRINVLQSIGIKAGHNMVEALKEIDCFYVAKTDQAAEQTMKESRRKKRMQNRKRDNAETAT